MAESTHKKLALAQQQLETAIGLFISRRDRISAISLAGAADGILHGLVLKAGKKPFADYAMGVREALSGETPAKAKYAKHINDKLNINDLKHMDEGGPDEVTLDPDISALGAISRRSRITTFLLQTIRPSSRPCSSGPGCSTTARGSRRMSHTRSRLERR